MERLTYGFSTGNIHCWQVKGADNSLCKDVCIEQGDNGCTNCPLKEAIDRLAAYENTGLEPEAIEQIKLSFMGKAIAEIKEFEGISVARLKELAQAEKDGRLVMLPCKIEDTVYIIRGERIIVATVEAIHQWSSGKWKLSVHTDKRYMQWVGYEIPFDDFGKTVFLTREEAEAVLKKREGTK